MLEAGRGVDPPEPGVAAKRGDAVNFDRREAVPKARFRCKDGD